jgi:hypothetical protein
MFWRNLWDDAYDMFIPNRNTINNRTVGETRNARVFDTTGVLAVNAFTSKMHSALTPPGMHWARLSPGSELTDEEAEQIAPALDKATEVFFNFLNQSNFELAVNESFFDLAIGTGALQIHEGDDDNPFNFAAVPLEQVAVEEGPFGKIETVWRRFEDVPFRNVKSMWPDAKIPLEVEQAVKGKPNAKLDFVEGTIFEPSNKPGKKDKYRYLVIEMGTKEIIVERVTESSVWVVYRWSKTPNEVFGRGPAMNALPSMLTLNKIAEFEMKAGQLAITPPWLGFRSGAFNPYTFQIMPNTIIPVDPIGAENQVPLRPLRS